MPELGALHTRASGGAAHLELARLLERVQLSGGTKAHEREGDDRGDVSSDLSFDELEAPTVNTNIYPSMFFTSDHELQLKT